MEGRRVGLQVEVELVRRPRRQHQKGECERRRRNALHGRLGLPAESEVPGPCPRVLFARHLHEGRRPRQRVRGGLRRQDLRAKASVLRKEVRGHLRDRTLPHLRQGSHQGLRSDGHEGLRLGQNLLPLHRVGRLQLLGHRRLPDRL